MGEVEELVSCEPSCSTFGNTTRFPNFGGDFSVLLQGAFLLSYSMFEPSLCELQSPFPGNGIPRPETKALKWRPCNNCPSAEIGYTEEPRQVGASRVHSGNLC